MVTAVSGATDSAKLLRHLEKAEAKGRLDTLYERRLLDYMRRGNTVVDQTEQAKQDFERQYKRCARKVNGIIAVVGLIVAMVLVFGLRALLFRGTRWWSTRCPSVRWRSAWARPSVFCSADQRNRYV